MRLFTSAQDQAALLQEKLARARAMKPGSTSQQADIASSSASGARANEKSVNCPAEQKSAEIASPASSEAVDGVSLEAIPITRVQVSCSLAVLLDVLPSAGAGGLVVRSDYTLLNTLLACSPGFPAFLHHALIRSNHLESHAMAAGRQRDS